MILLHNIPIKLTSNYIGKKSGASERVNIELMEAQEYEPETNDLSGVNGID